MLTLHDLPLSLNCYKVRLILGILGVPYRRQPVDLMVGEQKQPAFLALNPFGEVPVLTDGKLVLRDSQAIVVWVARKHGGEAWMPRDPDDEAIVNAWLAAAAYELRLGPYDARLAKLFPVLCVNPATVQQRSASALGLYEARLRERDWIALDRPTVADIAAFPAISQSSDGDISLEGYPAIRAWLDRVRALPGFCNLLD
jgi:glutathione S-transferase